MTITGAQARMARVGLGYSMQDMHKKFGFSKSQISDFESKGVGLGAKRIEMLENHYKSRGVEFIGNTGVNIRDEYMYTLNGVDGMRSLYDDIYETARHAQDGEFCIFNGVPNMVIKWTGKDWYENHSKRMVDVRDNITFKVIVEEGTTNLIGDAFVEYRYWPSGSFLPEMLYIFGNKVAFFSFSEESVNIRVNVSEAQANSMRILFSSSWDDRAIKING